MNKIDIVKAVKNHQTTFTQENTGCPDLETFQAIAEAIIETENEGYITNVITHEFNKGSGLFKEVSVLGIVTPIGEDLLEMEEAKGSFY